MLLMVLALLVQTLGAHSTSSPSLGWVLGLLGDTRSPLRSWAPFMVGATRLVAVFLLMVLAPFILVLMPCAWVRVGRCCSVNPLCRGALLLAPADLPSSWSARSCHPLWGLGAQFKLFTWTSSPRLAFPGETHCVPERVPVTFVKPVGSPHTPAMSFRNALKWLALFWMWGIDVSVARVPAFGGSSWPLYISPGYLACMAISSRFGWAALFAPRPWYFLCCIFGRLRTTLLVTLKGRGRFCRMLFEPRFDNLLHSFSYCGMAP